MIPVTRDKEIDFHKETAQSTRQLVDEYRRFICSQAICDLNLDYKTYSNVFLFDPFLYLWESFLNSIFFFGRESKSYGTWPDLLCTVGDQTLLSSYRWSSHQPCWLQFFSKTDEYMTMSFLMLHTFNRNYDLDRLEI